MVSLNEISIECPQCSRLKQIADINDNWICTCGGCIRLPATLALIENLRLSEDASIAESASKELWEAVHKARAKLNILAIRELMLCRMPTYDISNEQLPGLRYFSKLNIENTQIIQIIDFVAVSSFSVLWGTRTGQKQIAATKSLVTVSMLKQLGLAENILETLIGKITLFLEKEILSTGLLPKRSILGRISTLFSG